jgi:hypothetical protein
MTPTQRQSVFDRFYEQLARRRASQLGLRYLGTLRKLPPPPLPGEAQGATRYYLNAVAGDGSSSGLAELGGRADAALRRAEEWVETGRGRAPLVPRPPRGQRKIKRKV